MANLLTHCSLTISRIFLSLTLAVMASTSRAEQLQISGVISNRNVAAPQSPSIVRFDASIQGTNWLISIERDLAGASSTTFRYRVGISNNMTYSIGTITSGTNTTYLGTIQPGPIPYIMGEASITILWLAYASSHYLDGCGQTTNLQPLFSGFNPEGSDLIGSTTPVELTRDAQRPGLPSVAKYFYSGTRKILDPITDQVLSTSTLAAPYQNGFLAYAYNVDEFMTTNGMHLPKRFTFRSYTPLESALKAEDVRLSDEYIGLVTNISFEVTKTLPDLPTCQIRIRDERFAGKTNAPKVFNYSFAGNRWLTDAEAIELPEYQRAAIVLGGQIKNRAALHLPMPQGPRRVPQEIVKP